MPEFERPHVEILNARLAESPRRLIALFGPRQTGKTTIVRQALGKARIPNRYVAVDDFGNRELPSAYNTGESSFRLERPRDREWLVQQWNAARDATLESRQGLVLVLDEIQKIPGWPDTVKGLWDADRAMGLPMHVVILGSAPLLIQQGISESLAGRFELIRVSHWSFGEMASAFGYDLTQYIYFGGYPGSAGLIQDQERWRDYILGALVDATLERDLLSMTRIDKPALLKSLFELGSVHSGQILSFSKMLGQMQDAGNTTTLARYLELLSNAGLLTGLQSYSHRPVRRRSSSPKLNVLNTALMTAGSGYTFEEALADRSFWGRIAESAVGAHLINTASSDMRVHYWRRSSLEVDFILQKGRRILALEVKSGPQRSAPSGLAEFQRQFQPEKSLVVGANGLPINELLAQPAGNLFDDL